MKMQRLIFTISIILFPVLLPGQSQNEPGHHILRQTDHSFRDASVSVSPNVLFNTPNGNQFAGGVKLRMFFSKRFSFDSDLVFSHDYIHFGPGLIGIPAWYLAFRPYISYSEEQDYSLTDLLGLGAVMLLSAEHTAYHIPVNNSLDASPYVSLLRLKQANKHEYPDSTGIEPGFAIGIEINKYLNKFILAPYVEYNMNYNGHNSGFNAGIYFGFYLPNKY